MQGHWFRIESEPEDFVRFLRYDLEHNTTPASDMHDLIQERFRTVDGLLEGPWRKCYSRVLAVRWDADSDP
jgi:hypothetical protein